MAKCVQRNGGENKGGSEVISLHWIQPSGFTLSSLNGQNATGRTGLKENKHAKCTGRGTCERRQGQLDAKRLFFALGKAWMMNDHIPKVINVSSWSAMAKFLGHLQRQEGFIGPSSSLFIGSRRHRVDTEGYCFWVCFIPPLLAQSSYQCMQQPRWLSSRIKHHSISRREGWAEGEASGKWKWTGDLNLYQAIPIQPNRPQHLSG